MNWKFLKKQAAELLSGEENFIANASNLASLLFNSMENINWTGFYLFDGRELVLGPFMGKPACIRIPPGKGVCGTSFAKRQTVIADDVHKFSGHIPCDGASNSEIVIPLIKIEELYGVLDIDSPVYSRFGTNDKEALEELAKILLNSSDMVRLEKYYNWK